MEGVSIIIPVFNKIETTQRCVDSITGHNKNRPLEVVIVDNGSTDETQAVFAGRIGLKPPPASGQITYIRNSENLGIAMACNIGARAARYDVLCFMHNDVFIFKNDWSDEIQGFISTTANSGIAGLYGAKTLRREGSFRGRTIVHAKKGCPAMKTHHEKVAVVDGMLMSMKKIVFDTIGGFCEDFPVHFYDKDISLRAVRKGFDNYVLNIPFEHHCGSTRGQIKGDDAIRDTAQKRFVEIWKDFLPADVTTLRERIRYLLRK